MRGDNFIHLDADIWQNEKVLRVADELDEDEDIVALSFIALLTYARAHQQDGDLSELGVRALRRVLRWHGKCAASKVIEAMTEVRFLSVEPLRITNFLEAHKKLLTAQRQARLRAVERDERYVGVTSELLPSDTNVTERDESVTEKEKEKEKEHKEIRSVGPSVDFLDWWDASGRIGNRGETIPLYNWWRKRGASPEDLIIAATNYHAQCLATGSMQMHGRTLLAKKDKEGNPINRWQEYVNPEPKPNGNGKKKRDTYQEVVNIDTGELAWFYSDDHTRVPDA